MQIPKTASSLLKSLAPIVCSPKLCLAPHLVKQKEKNDRLVALLERPRLQNKARKPLFIATKRKLTGKADFAF